MRVLFVCTGNTCRSPMAQALAQRLAEKKGISLSCDSAGLAVFSPSPMAEHARLILEERGISDFSHQAQKVSAALLSRFDLAIGMTPDHALLLTQRFAPACPVCSMPIPVGDPFGQSAQRYRQTADAIEQGLNRLFAEGILHE